MKILILSRYSRLGASSRLRLFQYIPRWEAAGITCVVHSLLNDRYLQTLYGGTIVSRKNVLRGYAAMAGRIVGAGRFDLVLIEKEVFPFLPALAEWWLSVRKIPYIVDYDDAIFHNYDLHPHSTVRRLLGGKIAGVMRRAASVVCGNTYLGAYAQRAGAKRVTLIPTVIDTDRYRPRAVRTHGPLVIGWIGSPTSLKYVRALLPVLRDLTARFDICLQLVGAPEGIGLEDREQVLPWSEDTEASFIGAFDIGIMPLEDSPWEQGKCGYKLIQYMGCGLPVVGSPVGVNDEIIQEGINGFKPRDHEAWTRCLERLIRDEHLRREMGARGRAIVLERYSLDRAAPRWIEEFSYVSKH